MHVLHSGETKLNAYAALWGNQAQCMDCTLGKPSSMHVLHSGDTKLDAWTALWGNQAQCMDCTLGKPSSMHVLHSGDTKLDALIIAVQEENEMGQIMDSNSTKNKLGTCSH
ncbi:hypothetical protein DPMN_086907 [Dreissena polymorpha]|uniref:Uncharacterized protein n=1 Tax=Dreissena polymorpha TaxID=45954 RepID=A0A9D4QVL7_DREPO|nr:hypothetical protein DPMN_086907 [Dreissena polymorpha]